MANKPLTRAMILAMNGGNSKILTTDYIHNGPNRQKRRLTTRIGPDHNNRKWTASRYKQVVELERAVIVDKKVVLEKTGKVRTIQHDKGWKWGGNTTHAARTQQR
jgi:hypothetical protein